jgi:prevent-host-death family protein
MNTNLRQTLDSPKPTEVATILYMKTLSLAEARQHFSEVVNDVDTHHDHVMVTKNGKPAAMIVSVYEWEQMEDTIFWLSQPGIHEDLAEADAAIARGDTVSIEEIKAELEERLRAEEEADRKRRAG